MTKTPALIASNVIDVVGRPIDATLVVVALHAQPVVTSLKVNVAPVPSNVAPIIAAGLGLTVNTAIAGQPLMV